MAQHTSSEKGHAWLRATVYDNGEETTKYFYFKRNTEHAWKGPIHLYTHTRRLQRELTTATLCSLLRFKLVTISTTIRETSDEKSVSKMEQIHRLFAIIRICMKQ